MIEATVLNAGTLYSSTERFSRALGRLHERGKLLASGPYVPRTGGALLLRAESEAELREIVARDPFSIRQIADYEVRVWAPTIGVAGLESLQVSVEASSTSRTQ